ncbi:hypothetical protein CBS147326_9914 [Penicillium roqueforti]|nr:hypothetical protein CBS147326_9914 [Penicillium roqueforti]
MSFLPVNTKTGRDAGHYFLTLERQCHNNPHQRSLYNNGQNCFIEVRGTHRRAVILWMQEKWRQNALDSTGMLAIAYRLDGRWKEAEQLEVQVMETRKTKLGDDHSSTLTSMANLASTYLKQGRWEEAEQLEVQVMEMSKTKLGDDHPLR